MQRQKQKIHTCWQCAANVWNELLQCARLGLGWGGKATWSNGAKYIQKAYIFLHMYILLLFKTTHVCIKRYKLILFAFNCCHSAFPFPRRSAGFGSFFNLSDDLSYFLLLISVQQFNFLFLYHSKLRYQIFNRSLSEKSADWRSACQFCLTFFVKK